MIDDIFPGFSGVMTSPQRCKDDVKRGEKTIQTRDNNDVPRIFHVLGDISNRNLSSKGSTGRFGAWRTRNCTLLLLLLFTLGPS
jgi:hypothetical protein